ncbi:MAG: hypothetical protein K0S58_1292 [Nitrospira sp.]|nr:hypothetical protein [Nitrospira sp.]
MLMDMATVQRSVPLPILLVDDSVSFRVTLRQILERYRDFAVKRMLPDLYVIGLSSNNDADTQTAMKTAGSSAFLSKSCTHQLPRLIALLTGRLVPVKISPEAMCMET